MHDDLLTGASPKATENLIEAWTAHVNASVALDGITPEQVVMMRRVLGAWPPPGGGDTW